MILLKDAITARQSQYRAMLPEEWTRNCDIDPENAGTSGKAPQGNGAPFTELQDAFKNAACLLTRSVLDAV
jgi:hypothetical protein